MNKTEIWMPIQGFEGVYEISNYGNCRRAGKRNIAPKIERNGYIRYHLSKDNNPTTILAHRAVAIAFIPNPNNYKTVNHKDENKSNNRVENLEWCDMHYQNTYGIGAVNRHKAKERAVLQFTKQGEFIKRFDSVSKAAQELNLNATSIHCVCKGIRRYKSTGGFVFQYEENKRQRSKRVLPIVAVSAL